ncbi:MAG: hypothetical protein CVU61_09120 [Deltaproteobacteria bacterium HGW-Deltaproteobacteria-19]|jgi:outer membrane lipoprotein-sorting protein|nr:MAG: hypothetical protein CVU61_09120 [Deltaproteobacteria bacterium HGW-Deltaproteobacteria-19]
MKNRPYDVCLLVVIILLAALLGAGTATPLPAGAAGPDPARTFAEVLRPYEGIQDYTVRIQAKVSIPDFRVPDFAGTVYFKQPDRFHLETKSFAPLPRGAALFDPARFRPEKNRIAWLAAEAVDGVPADVFRVEPLEEKGKVRSYRVWVGGNPKRILQVESISVQGGKARARIRYALVRQGSEGLWLPERVDVQLTFPERGVRTPDSPFHSQDSPVSRGMARLENMPAEGSVSITYSGWTWNTGLDDALFKKK